MRDVELKRDQNKRGIERKRERNRGLEKKFMNREEKREEEIEDLNSETESK